MRALRALTSAFSYFTILPTGSRAAAPDGFALSFLPFVGLVVGALAGSIGYGLALLTHANLWGWIGAWVALVALSGAIHIDGFLDCCDALFAATTPQRRLEILHDPRHGSFAVVGMAVLCVVWLGLLMPFPARELPLVLACSGGIARSAPLVNAWIFPYARPGRVTPAFTTRPSWAIVAIGLVAVAGIAYLVQPLALVAIAVCVVVALLAAWWASRRLGGGLTGDVYGALIVVSELAALTVISTLATLL